MIPFKEIQMLNPAYILIVLFLVAAVSKWIWSYFKLGEKKRLLLISSVPYLLIMGCIIAFTCETLSTRIDETGIHYLYFPGSLVTNEIKWDEIAYTKVTTFKPWFKEVSRGAMASDRHKNEYAISGDAGLWIRLKNGTDLIIGTQKPDDLRAALRELVSSGIIDQDRTYSD